ncbi:hypothetical protein H2200_009559 [Cladophialophora chaetospira]|uniref:AB hydrolase-1 domain-containing protein n=1 Tax=Cladophialophora chaetospira TaxID=386627 RepID=A0AA38X2W2_9EURO|nr:hypothetical protein H2200_009559 [Cladophialophora chaetospira]
MATYQTAKTQYITTHDNAIKFAYRQFGTPSISGVPLLFLIHFRGTMDKWDPLLINSTAQHREVILVDYAGLGQSTGRVATSFRESAADIATFLSLIGVKKVDVLGFSIGALVGQLLALNHSTTSDQEKSLHVRKLIIAGSSSSIGPDMPETTNDYKTAATAATLTVQEFKELFFPRNAAGEKAAEEWWARVSERNESTSGEVPSDWGSQGFKDGGAAIQAQAGAYGKILDVEGSKGLEGTYDRLGELKMPVLVAQGSDDFMFPTINSFHLQQKVPNGQLIVYPNSGHGFLYQYAETFAKHVGIFLDA